MTNTPPPDLPRHPTGDPELTGGWYRPEPPAPEPTPATPAASEAPTLPPYTASDSIPRSTGDIGDDPMHTQALPPYTATPPPDVPLLSAPLPPPAMPLLSAPPPPATTSDGPTLTQALPPYTATPPPTAPTLPPYTPPYNAMPLPPATSATAQPLPPRTTTSPAAPTLPPYTAPTPPAAAQPFPPRTASAPASYPTTRQPAPPPLPPYQPPSRVTAAPAAPSRGLPRSIGDAGAPPPKRRLSTTGCLLRAMVAGITLMICGLCGGVTTVIGGYFYYAQDLPSIDDLRANAGKFQTSYIYDRNGQELFELNDPTGGRRTSIPLSEISPYLQNATIATEDKDFYNNAGFDPIGIVRAIKQGMEEGTAVSGASTITQQLVRALVFTPEEASERSARRKIREIILAAEISRRYSKDEILALYLNEIYYGNIAYGIEAASQTYYGVHAKDLTIAQASLLAGLPQSPAVYDPFSNYDLALDRQEQVLTLMVREGYITQAEADEAHAWALAHPPVPHQVVSSQSAPHFVNYVRQVLEARYGGQIFRGGYRVTTSLDPALQASAQAEVSAQINALASRHVTNGSLIALDPRTGEILAMVGSTDYNNDEIGGQVNVALRCRQPGSSIKPLTYLATLIGYPSASGQTYLTIGTPLWDVPTQFPQGPGQPPYEPQNYDLRFHGPVSMRTALANSYNIPAVRALQFINVENLLTLTDRFGVLSLRNPQDPEVGCPDYPYTDPPQYGLALTLGGGETTLLEMTGAYATLANAGQRVPPVAILKVVDRDGNVLEEYTPPAGEQAATAGQAFLVTDMLSDNPARCPAFGCPNVLELSRPAAVKTGTTNDYRDNWTIGYTPDLAIGVWVGNNDNTPMEHVSGVTGAGPIWHNVMEAAFLTRPAIAFVRPSDVVEMEVCDESGAQPSEKCPHRHTERFTSDRLPPSPASDLWQKIPVDRFTGLRANEFCPNNVEERWFVVLPEDKAIRDWLQISPDGQAWAQARNMIPLTVWGQLSPEEQQQAIADGKVPLIDPPKEACTANTGQALAEITAPTETQQVAGVVEIRGSAQAPDFAYYTVEYGFSQAPGAWGIVQDRTPNAVSNGVLALWDTAGLEQGQIYTLRVIVYNTQGGRAEGRPVHIYVIAPSPTPEPTATETPVPTNTPFPTDTPTALATFTPEPSATVGPTSTPPPSATAGPTSTPAPTDTPLPPIIPPTDTPLPIVLPTDTPLPPIVLPTDTPAASEPTNTPAASEPTVTPPPPPLPR